MNKVLTLLFATILYAAHASAEPSTSLKIQIENANLYLMAGQLDKAEPLFLDIVNRTVTGDPLRTNALIQLLDIAEKNDTPKLASRWIIELLPGFADNTPQRINLEIRLARHQLALDNFPVVVNRLAPLLNTPSLDRQAPLLVAYALVQLNRYQAASPVIDLALNNHPEPPRAWLELQLNIRWQLEHWQPAIETLQKLLTLEPGNPERWQQLASLYSYTEQKEKTLASLEVADRLTPDTEKLSQLINHTSSLKASTGQPDRAAQQVDQALASNILPTTEKNHMRKAALWLQARETEKALGALADAGNLANNGEALWLRGRLLLSEERWQEAAEDFQRALQQGNLKNPDQTALLSGYAWWQANNFSQARKAFKQALAFDDTRQQAQDWLNWLNAIEPSS